MNKKSFFEIYAHEYDMMTDAHQREKMHDKEVAAIIEKFKPEKVLDAGCATGLTSMLFARRGITTVGFDRSRKMIELAKRKFHDSNLPLSFKCGHFEKIPKGLHGKFDLVVCLANSISGVGTLTGLQKSLDNFHVALKPGGVLLLQLLNYRALQDGELMPVKVTENDGLIHARMTERQGKCFRLYVLRIDLKQTPPRLEAFQSEFDNFTEQQVMAGLKKARFTVIHKYANLLMDRKYTRASRDLVISAAKPSGSAKAKA
ncbi:MAG: class I SAM-dependent methyltransferase [Candidatus Zixiibacteriota bacterium]